MVQSLPVGNESDEKRIGLLAGKVAFITGAARGLGRAHAVTCAREGADVILVDICKQVASAPYATARDEDLTETVRQVEALGRRALAATADVRSQEQLDDAVSQGLAKFGQIDILIANAGIWTLAPFGEITEQMWRSAKAVSSHMIERQTGSIVISSSARALRPGKNAAHYVASKLGAIGLMKAIALELAPHGIRCNAVCPGAIDTPMTNQQHAWDMYAGHKGGTEDDMWAAGYRLHALKNTSFLSPQAIADTVLFLNSHLAATVTGVVIPIDAGHLILPGVNLHPVKPGD
jgi:NAD(P)-dependent dehydrogenase (short-subunit alcohol dehydrogenase family)